MSIGKVIKEQLFSSLFGRQCLKHRQPDCYVISYRKSGRTWLRMLIAKSFAHHFGYSRKIIFDSSEIIRAGYYKAPYVDFTHGDCKNSEDPDKRYVRYHTKKVIFLVRDPRDVIISYYYYIIRRGNKKHNSLSSFIRDPIYGIDSVIAYMNYWHSHRHFMPDFLLVRYEDLHHNTACELRKILEFIGLFNISDKVINDAVEYASFQNMRRMSTREFAHEKKLAPANPLDQESYKVRIGKVGGYIDEMDSHDIEYVNNRIQLLLDPFWGY